MSVKRPPIEANGQFAHTAFRYQCDGVVAWPQIEAVCLEAMDIVLSHLVETRAVVEPGELSREVVPCEVKPVDQVR